MKQALIIFLASSALLLQACASRISVVESADVSKEQLEADMAECRQYANEYDGRAQITESVLLGAFLTGLQAWIASDGDHGYTNASAIYGGIEGGAIAASDVAHERDYIVKNCLSERGYIVLN